MNTSLKCYIRENKYLFVLYNIFLQIKNDFFNHNKISYNKGNNLIINESVLKYCNITITGKNNIVSIDKGCSLIGMRILLQGNNNVVSIGKSCKINASKTQPTVINASGGSKIIIGDNCLFSNNIEIHSSDYHKIFNNEGQIINKPRNIIIGNHVWIGLGCTILKGTKVNDDCVIGTQSLLNKVFDNTKCIIAGNPAQIVKQNINWDY